MGHSSHQHANYAENPALRQKHRRALGAVMYINAGMAVIEAVSGIAARSTALFTDMLEMASDATSAGLGRVGVNRSRRWQARASLAKAAGMMALGIGAASWAVFRIFNPLMPAVNIMTAIGGLALGANATCVGILHKYRNDNLNLKSSYECVRNDVVGNLGVIGAGLLGKALASGWPDVIISLAVSSLFIKSSVGIMREAIAEIKTPTGKSLDDHNCGHSHSHDLLSPKFVLRLKNSIRNVFNLKSSKTNIPAPPAPPHKTCDHNHHHSHP